MDVGYAFGSARPIPIICAANKVSMVQQVVWFSIRTPYVGRGPESNNPRILRKRFARGDAGRAACEARVGELRRVE